MKCAVVVLGFVAALWGLPSAVGATSIDELWALNYLIGVPRAEARREIERRQQQAEFLGEDKLALGILHIHQYIWYAESVDLRAAEKYLSAIGAPLSRSPLVQVYRGMLSAFQAERKTVFGVGDLKAMRDHLSAIPEDHPNWFIRYLRGTTLFKVGQALPGIWPLKKMKKRASALGGADLRFVLKAYQQHSERGHFDLSTYDRKVRPVPEAIKHKVEQLLALETPK